MATVEDPTNARPGEGAGDEPTSTVGGEDTTPSLPAPREGVSGLGVAAVVLAVALAVVAGVAVVGWQRAERWERRAQDRAAVVREMEQRVTTSESEITALETRLDELASEKAGTEDEREAARLDAEQLEELVRQAGLVATDLDSCARGAVDVVNLVSSLGDYDLDQVNRYVADVQQVCSQALAENDALQQAIDGLDAAPAEPAPGGADAADGDDGGSDGDGG